MILSLRQIKSKIRSIENVKKVTRAMEMIATAKFRSMESEVSVTRQYLAKIETLMYDLLSHRGALKPPLLDRRDHQCKIVLCVIASDTGLCSTYNSEMFACVEDFIRNLGHVEIELVVVGKKCFNYFKKRGFVVRESFLELHGRYSEETTRHILNTLVESFVLREAGSVFLAYTHFETTARHMAKIEKLFPIDPKKQETGVMLFEPDVQRIIEDLIPVFVFHKIKTVLLESFASEHAARMMAMGEATENARGLLEDMVLLRNKVRQANITKEILEISSTAEVLR